MKILAIHDGHTGTACLFEDGKILGMASEERFTKVKNQGGFPKNTIKWLLESSDTKPDELDHIVFPGFLMPIKEVNAHNRHRHTRISSASKFIPDRILSSSTLTDAYIQKYKSKREKLDYYKDEFSELGLDKSKAKFIEHHTCHAATAYYLDWNYSPKRKSLVFTLDGSGDGLSATVSIGHGDKLERIKKIHTFNSLGMIYSRTTALMGMKPLEHEYKLMGMAPYSPDFLTEKAYKVFKKYIKLDKSGLSFENTSGVYGNQLIKKLHKDLYLIRFDAISAGLQKLTEELALQWILNWVKKTGIRDITLAGGVFMNVKLNMLINESKEIDSVFFMPSCGDESIALGAALETYASESNGSDLNIGKIENLYFGPEYSDDYIGKVLASQDKFKYEKYDDINTKVVEYLMDGKIVGRAHGKMEFGARSLGNRSIIANPKNYEIVSKINRAIKMRDFWMPFAASILDTSASKYLVTNRKPTRAPFMILGFDTSDLAREDIKAGLHQQDFTCRPQIVEKNANPEYYDLIKKFESASGISGVLNTSFNIHGYPIVNSPEDALWTLENSDLDAVQIGNYFVERN
jgi:carbamoyltransferase